MFKEWAQRVGSAWYQEDSQDITFCKQLTKNATYWKGDYQFSQLKKVMVNWKPSPGLIYPLLR